MTTKYSLIIALCLPALTAMAVDYSKPKQTVMPLVTKAPMIDGKLNDPAWRQASRATNFLDLARLKKTVSEQTEVLMCRDEKNLYFAFTCYSHDPKKIIANKAGRDTHRTYKDDVIQIFLDTEHSRNDFYHWTINSKGAIWDAVQHRLLETERMIPSVQWNSKVQAASQIGEKSWTVEVRISLDSFEPRDLKALRENKTWGLQLGRGNRTAPGGKNVPSTWSRTYSVGEPMDFGVVKFTGKPIRETAVAWTQAVDPTLFLGTRPTRPAYQFTRTFDFGPNKGGAGQDSDYPKGVTHVTPSDSYTSRSGFGFETGAKRTKGVEHKSGTEYAKPSISPLVKDYVTGDKKTTFLFDLPAGDYRAMLASGTHLNTSVAPYSMDIDINGSTTNLTNYDPRRWPISRFVDFSTNGKRPVRLTLTSQPGTKWVVNFLTVYPRSDHPLARRAIYWLRRDFSNYPFENQIKNRKVWIRYPIQKSEYITSDEREKGFALVNLPAAHTTPRTYIPQREDGRGVHQTIASPGGRVTLQFAFHALREFKDLRFSVDKSPSGVRVLPMMTSYQIKQIGRAGLGQWGYVPHVLTTTESTWLESGLSQPYVLIMDVAADAKPGVHTGTLRVSNGDKELVSREFNVVVTPFTPRNHRQLNSMYYNPLFGGIPNQWSQFSKSEKDLMTEGGRNELVDFKRHGIDYVHTGAMQESYQKDKDGVWHFKASDAEGRFFTLLKETGIRESARYISGYEPGDDKILWEAMRKQGLPRIKSRPERYKCDGKLPASFFANLTGLVRENIAARKRRGLAIPPFEVWDEPGHINSHAIIPFLDAIRKGGGKNAVTLVAGCFPALDGKVDYRVYNGIGLGVEGGQAESPERILKQKKKDGSLYSVYHNGTIMEHEPRLARMTFGYWGWAWNLDGIDPYKYGKIYGDPLLGKSFHPMIYKPDGTAQSTTLSWEMHAEATYDNNLVQMLEDLTANGKTPAARESRKFLSDLKKRSAVGFSHIFWGYSTMTGKPNISKQVWPAVTYERLRAELVRRIMEVSGEKNSHPKIFQAVSELEAASRAAEKTLHQRISKGLAPRRTGNLLKNSSFEAKQTKANSVPGFSIQGRKSAWSLVKGGAHTGQTSLQLENRGKKHSGARANRISLVSGRQYRFTGWVKRKASNVAGATGFWLHTFVKQGDGKYSRRLWIRFPSPVPTFDWTRFSLDFQAENEREVEVWLYCTDKSSTIWVDDWELLELES